jgi:hypothetical protein
MPQDKPGDTVIPHSNAGVKISPSLPTSIQQVSKISYTVDAARGDASIPVSDPKATAANWKYGNIFYVKPGEPSQREYAGLPWPVSPGGTEIADGEIIMQLRSYEWILQKRCTAPKELLEGVPGDVFIGLLNAARREGALPISTSESAINKGGESIKKEYNFAPIYETINDLAEENDFYWWLQPSIDPTTNRLVLTPNWRPRRSRVSRFTLRPGGDNPNFRITKIRESGEIANHIIAYARFESWDEPVWDEIYDRSSIGFYKQVFTDVIPCLEETTKEGLRPILERAIYERAIPLLYIDGAVLKAPYPQPGDIVPFSLPAGYSFIVNRRKSIIQMQVEGTVRTPEDNSFGVSLKEIRVPTV